MFEQFYTIEPTADVSIKNRDGVVRVYGSRADRGRQYQSGANQSVTRNDLINPQSEI
jgi:hypothetical protein